MDDSWLGSEALAGLADFSHAQVVFLFDRVNEGAVVLGARHPRGMTDLPKVGIFAQRGKDRPNRLGLSTCEIVSVQGSMVSVRGLDAIDGTPVLDIKPFMRSFEPRGSVREPAWVETIMKDYW